MSLKKGSQSSKQTSDATGSSTTLATNPDWVTNGVQGLMDEVTNLDSTSIPGASELQTQAFATGANLPSGAARYGAATTAANGVRDVAPGQVQAASLLDNLGSYMSPYTHDVVDATLNDFDVNAGRTRAAQAAAGAGGSQAFGGSRWGVQEGQTEGELARARATADATLRDSAFTTGAGLSNQDAGRRQEVALANAQLGQGAGIANQGADLSRAGLLGGFATASQGADAQNLGLLSGLGETQRGIETSQSPLALLAAKAGLLGDLPLDLFDGQTTDTTANSTGSSKGKASQFGISISDIAKMAQMAGAAGGG